MKTTRIKLVFLMLLLAGGCRDVFEKDISEKDVVLVAPDVYKRQVCYVLYRLIYRLVEL